MKIIGMIAAMDAELKAYTEKINARCIEGNCPYEVYYAESHGKKLYILKSGIGEIAAAAATQYLISVYNVQAVLNFGICGKINPGLNVLDTLAVTSVVHYRFDLSGIDDVAPAVYKGNTPYMPLDRGLTDIIKKAGFNVKEAVCASGDIFLSEKEDIEDLWEKYRADICEMELAGILITCDANLVPCAAIKSVSDDGDAGTYTENKLKAVERHIKLIDGFVRLF